MRNLLVLFGVMTFITHAHCKPNSEILTIDNDSNYSINVYAHFGEDKQDPVIVKPGTRAAIPLSTLEGIGEGQPSLYVTLGDDAKGKSPQDLFTKRVFIQKKSSSVRITRAVTDLLK